MDSRPDSRFTDYEDDFGEVPLQQRTGTKRLFSNRDSRCKASEGYSNDQYNESVAQKSGKRYRSSEWPLPNPASRTTAPQTKPRLEHKASSPSPRARHSQTRSVRPSKFQEGSMNDRISQKPPTPYLGDKAREQQYRNEHYTEPWMAQSRKAEERTSRTGSQMGHPDTVRQSGIFRFGKSIAASFNPTNWKIWSKPQQGDGETPHQRMLNERMERAKAEYEKLKREGLYRDATHRPPVTKSDEVLVKHDSGIVLGRPKRASSESFRSVKRNGMVFLEPPSFESYAESPGSNVSGSVAGSMRRKSFSFTKPSLPSIKKRSDREISSNPPWSGDHHARRIPSRKDLQKQQKLVRKVSNLELKLETARRQLADATKEPLASQVTSVRLGKVGRPPFVPGTLATLPSERLLTGHVPSDVGEEDGEGPSEVEVSSRIGRAVTMDDSELAEDSTVLEQEIVHIKNEESSLASIVRPKHQNHVEFGSVEIMGDKETRVAGQKFPARPSGRGAQPKKASNASETSSRSYQPIEASYYEEDDEEDELADEEDELADEEDELADDPMDLKSEEKILMKNTFSKSKKRMSFERVVDNSSTYCPTEDDESEEDLKSEVIRHKLAAAPHPEMVQKPRITLIHGPMTSSQTARTSSHPVKKVSLPLNQRQSSTHRRQGSGMRSEAGSAMSCQHSKLQKTQSPIPRQKKAKQAMSPPPSSSFSDPEMVQSSSSKLSPHVTPHNTYIHDTSVHPVPPLPETVRFANGEVVKPAHHQTAKLSKLKIRRVAKGGVSPKAITTAPKLMKHDKSFEWPEDVF
ncbi:hypothetical protein BJ878DRAFT_498454 [Calycina marina]|uniref:Nuclear RNA binding protein n=1 Tax=Calycina marina TaxID=1763456 RepID=A0A9P7Z6P8_9HELO|nr:hypothetical protein BJ878DRAFT_498454 [Calycina marina]